MRPEAATLARAATDLARRTCSAFSGRVASLLFDGANSAVLVREAHDARARSASPCRRPGAFADLAVDEARRASASTRSGPSASRGQRPHGAEAARSARASPPVLLLLAPALVWLVGLIVLPHVELAHPVVAHARGAARLRDRPRPVPHVLRRAAVLAHVRAHGRDVDRRHALHAAGRLSDGLDHRQDRARAQQVAVVRALPDPVLGERDRAHARLDDPAARIRRAAAPAGRSGHHRGAGRDCSTTTRRSWSASSTPRCCSWWCRW